MKQLMLTLTPRQVITGRTDWLVRWNPKARVFEPVDTETLVVLIVERKIRDQVRKR